MVVVAPVTTCVFRQVVLWERTGFVVYALLWLIPFKRNLRGFFFFILLTAMVVPYVVVVVELEVVVVEVVEVVVVVLIAAPSSIAM